MIVSFPDLRNAVLGSALASVRTEHVRLPEDGSLSRVLGVIVAFGDDRRAFRLSVNASGDAVSIREWAPAQLDMGEYGAIVTQELALSGLKGATVSDLLSSRSGDQENLAMCLDNKGRIIVAVAGDEVGLKVVQSA